MTAAGKLTVAKALLHRPSLDEVASVLQTGLSANFANAKVSVVDCPDLTQKPFSLMAPGLCGNPRLADIGGVPYLIPLVQRDKKYDLSCIPSIVDLPDALMIGAGAGPYEVVGCNSEMIANFKASGMNSELKSGTYSCKVDPKDGSYILQNMNTPGATCLVNLYLCEGKPGKVLEVKVSNRTGSLNLMNCLRGALQAHYGDKPVALGGVFLVETGKAKIHVMPDFSTTPLNSEEDVNNWLNFYEMNSPLTCLGELISVDPGLDLRVEHFHCYSDHGDGGHFHFDTTPAEVSYRAYFNVAEFMYRIDRPQVTHQIGRDQQVTQ